MNVGNLVAIKRGRFETIRSMKTDEKHEEYVIGSLVGIIEDIIVSEKDGKSYLINGHNIKDSDVVGFKVLVE